VTCVERKVKIGHWFWITLRCGLYPGHRGACRSLLASDVTVQWPQKEKKAND